VVTSEATYVYQYGAYFAAAGEHLGDIGYLGLVDAATSAATVSCSVCAHHSYPSEYRLHFHDETTAIKLGAPLSLLFDASRGFFHSNCVANVSIDSMTLLLDVGGYIRCCLWLAGKLLGVASASRSNVCMGNCFAVLGIKNLHMGPIG
jgi:hypothetical protein